MKPHVTALSQPEPVHNRVAPTVTADLRSVHVLLTRVQFDALGYHRAGYVTLDDGLAKAPLLMAMELSILEATGLIFRTPLYGGDQLILLTAAGEALLDRLDAEQWGAL